MSEDPLVRQAAVLRWVNVVIGAVNALEWDAALVALLPSAVESSELSAAAALLSEQAAEGVRDEAAGYADTFTAPTKSVLDDIMGGDVAGLAATVATNHANLPINVKDYGAEGDGVTNDTAAIQFVLNTFPGREISVPRGDYLISSPLNVPSGTHFHGETGTRLVASGLISSFIVSSGAWGATTELSAAVTSGSVTIGTKTAHGLVVGDVARIVSQRVSTSTDAGEWQLGHSTGTTPGPFFAEFVGVREVNTSTQFLTDTGLIFPGYRPDATLETAVGAGTSATVAKFLPAAGVRVENFELVGISSQPAVQFIASMNGVVSNIRHQKANKGLFVQFIECYKCEARDCEVVHSYIVDEANGDLHYQTNSYHIIGSQSTGFLRCKTTRGSQCFDITYSNQYRFSSVSCYIDSCASYSALYNCATTHPGTYNAQIINNNFSECLRSGIALRSNKSLVQGNTVRGSGAGWGIAISEGGGKQSLIQSNTVDNFLFGLSVREAVDKYFRGWIGITFQDNYVLACSRGYSSGYAAGRPAITEPQGITLEGNTFESASGFPAISVNVANEQVNGFNIENNRFRMTTFLANGISMGNNAVNVVARNNTFYKVRAMLVFTGTTSGGVSSITWQGNNDYGSTLKDLPECTSDFQVLNESLELMRLPASFSLNNYKKTAKWVASSRSVVTIAKGYPVDDVDGWVDVLDNGGYVFQLFHQVSGGTTITHIRKSSGASAWFAWSIK